ncbi:hypothetical protein SAMN06265379_102257 [Saccharicrinis carchari]|uniref:Uncharacterized protein n=1 Tax=Saccharicrinis carchari TaxID=1168039 RepID=A0A521BZM9_SACCC|nr:hypothetical protein SAMN06265379_102257 [Saccharicrinis carchari]
MIYREKFIAKYSNRYCIVPNKSHIFVMPYSRLRQILLIYDVVNRKYKKSIL